MTGRSETRLQADAFAGASHARLIERFRAAMDGVSSAFYALDETWRVVAFNRAAEAYFGFGPETVLGRSLWDIFPEGRGTPFGDALERAMAQRESSRMRETSSLRPGRDIDIAILPWDDGICVAIDDLTEREAPLRQSEERFRSLYNSIEAGFYIAELKIENGVIDYRYIETNPAMERITGLKDVNGLWRREISGAPEEFWFDLFARVVKTQTPERLEHYHEGLHRWMDAFAYPVGAPEEQRFALLFNDITERKIAEIEREERANAFRLELEQAVLKQTAELRASEARMRAIFETSHMYQGLLDLDGHVLYVNATALKDIGAPLAEVTGRAFWACPWFASTQGAPEAIKQAIARAKGGETVASTMSLDLPVGRRHFEFALRPSFNERGEVAHILPEAIDITARVEAEAALRQSQKLEAMGQLTGGVAHDFNNLLMIVSGGLNMLERAQDAARREMLVGRMRDAVERGAKLTQQLLAFSRKHELAPQSLDFAARIESIRELLERSLGGQVRVALDIAPNLAPIHVDPTGLQQALLNLTVNARDAMPEGGIITIKAFNGTPDDAEAPFVSVSVIDHGIGMAPDLLPRIFEPFFTTKDVGQGSGLGLAQVHGFAQQSGGRVELQSTPGEGTTMTLVLPRSERAAEQEAASIAGLSPQLVSAGQALLVEDDDDVAAFTYEMLSELGWRVQRASSGEAALGELEQNRDVDFVFSDVMMPGGMSGLELSRRVRALRPNVPILLTSGYAAPVAQEAARLGLSLLPKPFTIEALAAAIARATMRPLDNDRAH